MAIVQKVGFTEYEETQGILEAAAANLGGFTINQDYDPEIEDYRLMETKFWRMIPQGNKKLAAAPTVKKIVKDKRARVGFVNRTDLSSSVSTNKTDLQRNLSDPGQEVKAISGLLDFPHFARSMNEQQNRPYGDEVGEDTDDMLKEAFRYLEMSLFRGDASVNPLEFNGLQAQIVEPNHIYTVDLTATEPERIWQRVNEIVMRATTDRNIMRKITHIFTTGSAYVELQKQVESTSTRFMEKEVIPGVRVPSLMTGDGEKPIISTPYLDNLSNVSGPSSAPHDVLRMWLLDINAVEWHGVLPYGGTRSLDPQIFDVTQYLSGQYLVSKRLMLMYGTPYLRNSSLYRIDIKAPLGSAWNVAP